MFGLLLLVAAGVGIFAFSGDDDPNPAQDEVDNDITTTNEADAIAGNQWAGTVDEDDILQARSLDIMSFVDGPIDVDTGGGDDTVLGSAANDTITTGAGDDYVLGDAGDDTIDLGDGDDIAGLALNTNGTVSTGATFSEPGDDTIRGGAGNDQISDLLGSNLIEGNQGNDTIDTRDFDPNNAVTPDTIFGGFGSDTLTVDEGDTVNTGPGQDTVFVDLNNFNGDGPAPEPVTISDFSSVNDLIVLQGPATLFATPPLTDPDEQTDNPVTELINPLSVSDIEDGSGANVFLNGNLILVIQGGAGLQVTDLGLRT